MIRKTPVFPVVPPGAQPPTWARSVIVEAAVPGETAGLVAEARSIDPVQPPAAGEAGWVPARTAAAGLCTASQSPGPQPRQSAQHHPQGPHGQGCGRTLRTDPARASGERSTPPTAAAAALHPPPFRTAPRPPRLHASLAGRLSRWHWGPGGRPTSPPGHQPAPDRRRCSHSSPPTTFPRIQTLPP